MTRRTMLLTGVLAVAGMLAAGLAACSDSFEEKLCELVPRPQHPKDRPYIVQEATIDGGAPGVRLAGELTMPQGEGPFPGIVLVSGAEVVGRDSKVLGHKFFLVLADYLTRRGYAVYRHDDRGYGESTGDSHAATDADYAADTAGAMKWLKAQDRIDATRTGYIGHSQGGLKAPLAATIEPARFMVFLAGGVQPNSTITLQQAWDFGKVAGLAEHDLQKQDDDLRRILGILRAARTVDDAHAGILAFGLDEGLSRREAQKIVDAYATPHVFAAIKWDEELFGELDRQLAQLIRSFDGPVLALYPEVDYFVRMEPNASLTRPLLAHPASRVVKLPGLNHMFQPAITGSIEETCEIEITFDAGALDVIGNWLHDFNGR